MAPVVALMSSLLWGVADFAGGLASRRIRTMVVVGWSQVSALVGMVGVVLLSGAWRAAGPWSTWLVWGLAAGLTGVGGLVRFYRALAMGTMGVVSPIAALGGLVPVLVGVAEGERPERLQVVGMVVALCGAVAASGPELSGSGAGAPPSRRSSVALAAAAGVLFGLTLVFMARGASAGPLLTVTAMRLTSLVLFGTVAVLAGTLGGVRPVDLPLLVGIGAGDAAANVLYGFASTMGLISVVAVLGSLYPVVTVLLARAVLDERLQPVQVAGVGLAMTGVALLSAT